jgi:predicted HTH transcriptional regulator
MHTYYTPGNCVLKTRRQTVICTKIHKGSAPPYYIKSKDIEKGTFIRVGFSNRQASAEMIQELERQKKNISFDSELIFQKSIDEIKLTSFSDLFLEKTGEKISKQILLKLELYKQEQGKELPTKALILLSDDEIRKQMFPYGNVECASFPLKELFREILSTTKPLI